MNFLFYIFLLLNSYGYHDYHIGLSEVDYNAKNKSLETSIRIFTEDLEDAIHELSGENLHLNTEKELDDAQAYIQKYLQKNVVFKVNNKEKSYKYLGREYEDDVIWMYLEVENVKRIKTLYIKNALLHDLFEDQINIVNVHIGDKETGEVLKKDSPSLEIEL